MKTIVKFKRLQIVLATTESNMVPTSSKYLMAQSS